MAPSLKEQFTEAFRLYGAEGRDAGASKMKDTPDLSHVCFKFNRQGYYLSAVDEARGLGKITRETFNGKEITWCKLDTPLSQGGLTLAWLELVEPKEPVEKNGVANIGYCLPGLAGAVKLSSRDGKMLFRYQASHAKDLAPKG